MPCICSTPKYTILSYSLTLANVTVHVCTASVFRYMYMFTASIRTIVLFCCRMPSNISLQENRRPTTLACIALLGSLLGIEMYSPSMTSFKVPDYRKQHLDIFLQKDRKQILSTCICYTLIFLSALPSHIISGFFMLQSRHMLLQSLLYAFIVFIYTGVHMYIQFL